MNTLISLKKIIDTLPLYEKQKLEQDGAEHVNVCLEDILLSMDEYERAMFFEENEKNMEIGKYYHRDLSDFSISEIEDYIESLGYELLIY